MRSDQIRSDQNKEQRSCLLRSRFFHRPVMIQLRSITHACMHASIPVRVADVAKQGCRPRLRHTHLRSTSATSALVTLPTFYPDLDPRPILLYNSFLLSYRS